MPLLDFFLVLAKLLLHPVHDGVDRTHQTFRLVVGDKVVLVLGGNVQIDPRIGFIRQIDDEFDGGKPIENP